MPAALAQPHTFAAIRRLTDAEACLFSSPSAIVWQQATQYPRHPDFVLRPAWNFVVVMSISASFQPGISASSNRW